MRRIGLNCCPYCGSSQVYRSQPKTWLDRASVLLLFRRVRCHRCSHRHYRPVISPALEYPAQSEKKSVQAHANEETRKRSA